MQDKSIQWMNSKIGRSFYSMTYRNGQVISGKEGYDCSSAEYYAAIYAGIFPQGHRIGNTDTLFGDLERAGWTQLAPNAQGNFDTQRGDKFIWGRRGASGGAAGHTGEFINANDVIHCAAFANGMTTNNYDQLAGWNGWPVQTFYRYTGGSAPTPPPQPSNPDDQNVDIGSWIKLDNIYTVNDVQLIGGFWQIKCDVLAPKGFTWDDNGIPAEPVYEVDAEGYATPDQNLDPGSLFKLPGKYQIQDLGLTDGVWWGLIEWNGLKFWVDINTATEISGSANGTPVPAQRPVTLPTQPEPTPEPETPVEPPKEEPQEPEQPLVVTPPVVTPPVVVPPVITLPNEDKPQGEDTMAFTQEQQKELAAQQQQVLDANNDFTPVISDNVKNIAYFATDGVSIAATFVLTVLAITHTMDAMVAITINAAVVAAMIGLKQTFRLSAKKS